MRRLQKRSSTGINPLWHMYRFIRFPKVLKQTVIIAFCRFIPSMPLKRYVYRRFLNMSIGQATAIAYKVTPDLFYPELISIGDNCVIGYNTTILTHEILVDEYRQGQVIIGDHTMIGANVTILPGVYIGKHVIIAAGSIVSKDIPDGCFACGNPIQIHRK